MNALTPQGSAAVHRPGLAGGPHIWLHGPRTVAVSRVPSRLSGGRRRRGSSTSVWQHRGFGDDVLLSGTGQSLSRGGAGARASSAASPWSSPRVRGRRRESRALTPPPDRNAPRARRLIANVRHRVLYLLAHWRRVGAEPIFLLPHGVQHRGSTGREGRRAALSRIPARVASTSPAAATTSRRMLATPSPLCA